MQCPIGFILYILRPCYANTVTEQDDEQLRIQLPVDKYTQRFERSAATIEACGCNLLRLPTAPGHQHPRSAQQTRRHHPGPLQQRLPGFG